MPERELQKLLDGAQKIPPWLWRLAVAAALVLLAPSTVVPWAQLQRGYASFGGEYLLIFAGAVLPFLLFRR